ncbi:MAG: hypothetical protein IPL61_30490 [Myxococcales bacterium]|nr:hypothetical protein [Myxococcales bacterium]
MATLAGCGFHPAGLTSEDAARDDAAVDDSGPGPDGAVDPDAADADAGLVDARLIDARPIDALPIDALPIDATLPMCPAGYGPLGTSTSRYREVTSTATWAQAAADCDNDDAAGGFTGFTHLIVIANDAERLALTSPPAIGGNSWVGLTDALVEGTFVWVTAEPTGGYPVVGQQPPWDNGDPNGGTGENCVRFKNAFTYEDKPCGDSNNIYVCECDAFPPL